MKILKTILICMFLGQSAFALDDLIINKENGLIKMLSCELAGSTNSTDNRLLFYAVVQDTPTKLTVYNSDDENTISDFEVFTDLDGCLDYAVKESDVPSYASLVVFESINNNQHVLIQGQARPTNPTPPPTNPNQEQAYQNGYQSGQLVAQVYNETLAFVAYARILIADDLKDDFTNTHIQSFILEDIYLDDSEADRIERDMRERALSDARSSAVSVAKQEAASMVSQAYSTAANNGQTISAEDVLNRPLPNVTFTVPSVDVGEEIKQTDFLNPIYVNSYVEQEFLDTLYQKYLEELYTNWPRSIFRSGTLFDFDGWSFDVILDEKSFEQHLRVIQNEVTAAGRYDYMANSFNSNNPKLVQARRLLEQSSTDLGAAESGFLEGFNELYSLTNTDYRAILNSLRVADNGEIENFEDLVEDQKEILIYNAVKTMAVHNYKVAVFDDEFSTAFLTAANDLFLDNYVETLDQEVQRYETSTILSFSDAKVELASLDEIGLLSETSVKLSSVMNIGKIPAESISMTARIAGSNVALTFPLSKSLGFGHTSEASTSASFEIPYNKSNLSYLNQTQMIFSVNGTSVLSLPVVLTAKAYMKNFAELFESICPDNADRTKRRFCDNRKDELGDVMGLEVREKGRQELFSYYDSFQPGSVVWALTQLESNSGLTDLLTHKYRRSNSVIDRVESYKPGLFGNRKVKALFDDALDVLDNVAR